MASKSTNYSPPLEWDTISLFDLLENIRCMPVEQQSRFQFGKSDDDDAPPAPMHCVGDLGLVGTPCVAIVGARKVSQDGKKRAARLARELAGAGVTVVSGLASGVDTAALSSALNANGRVIGVIGTPLDKVTPKSNARMQELIAEEHLLISPFQFGSRVYKTNFPHRNKVMAAITDATVIVEASNTSGTIHQAAECQRLGRWLYLMKSLVDNRSVTWTKSFLKNYNKACTLQSTIQILEMLGIDTDRANNT